MYVKVHINLLTSSLWAQDAVTCKIWITLLVLCDQNGFIEATAPGIATLSHTPLERTREVLESFQSPDPDSRTSDNEGRRIEKIEGGFIVLNYPKYRAIVDPAKVRELTRLRVAAHRDRQKSHVTNVTHAVTPSNDTKTNTNTNTKTKTKKDLKSVYIKGEDEHTSRAKTPPSQNSPGLRTSRGKSKPTAIGDIVKSLMSTQTTGDVDTLHHRLLVATRDKAFKSPGWKSIIAAIAATPKTMNQLETLLDRLEKDTDPRLAAARDHDCIKSPARFASSELKRIQGLLKN